MDVNTVSERVDYLPLIGWTICLALVLAVGMSLFVLSLTSGPLKHRLLVLRSIWLPLALVSVLIAVLGGITFADDGAGSPESQARAGLIEQIERAYDFDSLALPDGLCLATEAAGPSRTGDYTHADGFGTMAWTVVDEDTCRVELFGPTGDHLSPEEER